MLELKLTQSLAHDEQRLCAYKVAGVPTGVKNVTYIYSTSGVHKNGWLE